MAMHVDNQSAAGTIIGFGCGFVNGAINTTMINGHALFETCVLACAGATVGFITTALIKKIVKSKLILKVIKIFIK